MQAGKHLPARRQLPGLSPAGAGWRLPAAGPAAPGVRRQGGPAPATEPRLLPLRGLHPHRGSFTASNAAGRAPCRRSEAWRGFFPHSLNICPLNTYCTICALAPQFHSLRHSSRDFSMWRLQHTDDRYQAACASYALQSPAPRGRGARQTRNHGNQHLSALVPTPRQVNPTLGKACRVGRAPDGKSQNEAGPHGDTSLPLRI